jgi:hypothetical protein
MKRMWRLLKDTFTLVVAQLAERHSTTRTTTTAVSFVFVEENGGDKNTQQYNL